MKTQIIQEFKGTIDEIEFDDKVEYIYIEWLGEVLEFEFNFEITKDLINLFNYDFNCARWHWDNFSQEEYEKELLYSLKESYEKDETIFNAILPSLQKSIADELKKQKGTTH